jgi:hypothetical protein
MRLWRDIRLMSLGSRPSWRNLLNSFEMEIDPDDPMDRAFYLGTYDAKLVLTIGEWVKQGDACLDIGAHKGDVTLYLA